MGVTGYNRLAVAVRYGRRFREIRKRLGGQEDAAAALKITKSRGSSISNIEIRSIYPPRRKTLLKHAEALHCEPWELLRGVRSEIDALRSPDAQSVEELDVVLNAWPLLSQKERTLFADTARRVLALKEAPPSEKPNPGTQMKAKRMKAKEA